MFTMRPVGHELVLLARLGDGALLEFAVFIDLQELRILAELQAIQVLEVGRGHT